MNEYEQKFRDYLAGRQIEAEWLQFDSSCHSVAEAASSAGVSEADVVKNICLISQDGALIVAIALGTDRVSTTRVGKALQQQRPRTATADEVLAHTGYPCGGTPSFGYPAITLIDPRVMDRNTVLSGGGSPRSLLRIETRLLLEHSGARIVRVRR